jgi:hypothetical protein
MSAQAPAKGRMFRTALLGAAVVVWQIYELTSAAEEPSRGVLTLHYVFLALGAIALVGSLIGYLKRE